MWSRARPLQIVTGLLVVLAAGCGGGGSADVTYSATKFSACLTGRDMSPQEMDTSPSSERYIDALDRLAGEAARQNGALQAFGNDALPNASTLYFLFFADADRAQGGRQRLSKVAREEHADDRLSLQGNLLTVVPKRGCRISRPCGGSADSRRHMSRSKGFWTRSEASQSPVNEPLQVAADICDGLKQTQAQAR